jgi:hypothetical protein
LACLEADLETDLETDLDVIDVLPAALLACLLTDLACLEADLDADLERLPA